MNMINEDKFQKFITPKDTEVLLKSVDDFDSLDEGIKYRAKTGKFSEISDLKSTGIFYADKENRCIAGMGFVYPDDEIVADLETIKKYRNRGIGTRIINDAVSMGAKYLAVKDGNEIALNLYKKNGFKEYYYDSEERMHYMSITGHAHLDDERIIKKNN